MHKPRILLVEDHQSIIDFTLVFLERTFTVDVARTGAQALAGFAAHRPDLVLLDLGLPGMDGMELFKQFRRAVSGVPVVIVTSRAAEMDRVVALEMGADDYVTKPFSARELAARCKTILSRTLPAAAAAGGAPAALEEKGLACGPLTLFPDACAALLCGQALTLTHAEFKLLELLVRHPTRLFERGVLINEIYGSHHPVTERSIDAYVTRLRRKFTAVRPAADPIQTVHSFGYRLNPALRSLS